MNGFWQNSPYKFLYLLGINYKSTCASGIAKLS